LSRITDHGSRTCVPWVRGPRGLPPTVLGDHPERLRAQCDLDFGDRFWKKLPIHMHRKRPIAVDRDLLRLLGLHPCEIEVGSVAGLGKDHVAHHTRVVADQPNVEHAIVKAGLRGEIKPTSGMGSVHHRHRKQSPGERPPIALDLGPKRWKTRDLEDRCVEIADLPLEKAHPAAVGGNLAVNAHPERVEREPPVDVGHIHGSDLSSREDFRCTQKVPGDPERPDVVVSRTHRENSQGDARAHQGLGDLLSRAVASGSGDDRRSVSDRVAGESSSVSRASSDGNFRRESSSSEDAA